MTEWRQNDDREEDKTKQQRGAMNNEREEAEQMKERMQNKQK